MALSQGTRLGAYEIVAAIGAGAMGEVYRARDTRLDRDVAIKVLPERVANDPAALARFEREAKAVASINHPGIMAIHDFGCEGGTAFAVLELLEGNTLREQLATGVVPQRKAIDWAAQVAHGLAAAHDQGVWHRDLKPENIFLTRDGRVKILDFGLAKQSEPASEGADADGATRTHLATEPGTVMGTVGYMAPEQVRAQPVDGRADIFALGAILYELLGGQRAFCGDSAVETMHAVLTVDPPEISLTGDPLAPALERMLRRCIEKQPEQRFQSARDLAFALESVSGGSLQSLAAKIPEVTASPTPRRRGIWLWVGLASAVAFLAGWVLSGRGTSAVAETTWVDLRLDQELGRIMVPQFDVAPDGRSLVYATKGQGLFLRDLGSPTARRIEGTDWALSPVFSPDGRWIAYEHARAAELRKIAVSGGASLKICDLVAATGISWSDDGSIVFAPTYNSGLARVSGDGGEVTRITTLDFDAKESSHGWPQALPGGRGVIFTVETSGRSFDDATIVVETHDGQRKVLIEGGTYGRYVATGHLLYVRGGVLYAAPFDLDGLRVTAAPVEVHSGVLSTFGRGAAHYAVSASGTLALIPWQTRMRHTARTRILLVAADGSGEAVDVVEAFYGNPAVSPEAKRVLVSLTSSNDDVWVIDLEREVRARLTFEFENDNAVWLPDGRRVVISSDVDGSRNLYLFGADGRGRLERLTESELGHSACSVSPDGKLLIYEEAHPQNGNDLWLLPLEGEPTPRPFRATAFREDSARFSPDGRWVAYRSDESGRNQIYLESLAGQGRVRVTQAGGNAPRWSRDGKALYFATANGIHSIGVTLPGASGLPRLGQPQLRYTKSEGPVSYTQYDVLPDGRLVLVDRIGEEPFRHLRLAMDWFEELRSRVDGS